MIYGVQDVSSGNATYQDCTINGKDGASAGVFVQNSGVNEIAVENCTIGGVENGTPKIGILNYGTAKLTVSGGSIAATETGISGNGENSGTDMELTDVTISAPMGIYHPQDGKLVVNGGTVINATVTGIEMRAGSLTVNGATITSTADNYSVSAKGSGSTVTGAAIAISQHGTNLLITVTINNATLTAPMALVQVDTVNVAEGTTREPVELAVNGGTFNGEVATGLAIEGVTARTDVIDFISGGEFDALPDEKYLSNGASAFQVGDSYFVVTSAATDVEKAKQEATENVKLYAAAKDIELTDAEIAEIIAIINDDTIIDVAGVASAKSVAIKYVDKIYNTLAQAKKTAIDEIKDAAAAKDATDTEEAQAAVVVPTSTLAAINSAVNSAQVTELKLNALAEIEDIRSYRKQISDLDANGAEILDAIAAFQNALLGDGTEANSGRLAATEKALKDLLAEIKTKVDAIATTEQLNAVKGELTDTINTAIDELSTAIVDVKSKAEENATAIEALGVDVSELKTAVSKITPTDLSSINDKLEVVNSEIKSAISRVETNLNGKLETLTTNVGTLTGKLEEINRGLLDEINELGEKSYKSR